MKTDQWKLPQVWESIARTSFSKELERRIDRIVRRKEESLALLKDELRLFQVEMKLSRTSILARMHHSYFVTLMPALRPTTRVLNGTDQVADATLGIGFLSAVSAGAAIYYLGAALVMPVIAPVIPYAGGAVAVAGIFKWLTDSNKRKDNEIANKRKAFEEAFLGRLKDAETAFNKQLDELANEFRDTASAFVPPIMLEAQACERLAAVRVRVARRLIDQSRANMTTLIAEARTIEIKT